jgi:hypothetical protein
MLVIVSVHDGLDGKAQKTLPEKTDGQLSVDAEIPVPKALVAKRWSTALRG